MPRFEPAQGVGRRGHRLVPCEGSRSQAHNRLDPTQGICPVCRQPQAIYDSSRVGHGLLVDHHRKPTKEAKADA